MSKLANKDKHILRLIERSKKYEGWASCSDAIWPLILNLPSELVQRESGGLVKLTKEGETVLKWLL